MKNTCQSCGQPLKESNRGTEADGSKSSEYCDLCYANGAFTSPDMTLEQMTEVYVEAMRKMHFPGFITRFFAKQQLPKLTRWKNS